MNNDIVVVFDEDRKVVEKGEAWVYTDTLNIAEVLGVEHKEVLKKVRDVFKDYGLKEDGDLNQPSSTSIEITSVDEKYKFSNFDYKVEYYKNKQNKDQPYYQLSKDLLVLVMFTFNRIDRAKEFQLAYIDEFNRKEQELQWYKARYMGIDIRNSLTDNVKEYLDNPQWYDYVNFTNLVYESLYKMTAKEIREKYNLDNKCNIRKFLSEKCLGEVKTLENELATFLSYGMNYEVISKMTKRKYNDIEKVLEIKVESLLDKI